MVFLDAIVWIGYKEDEIHFIVMGEEQDMSDNDWTTTIMNDEDFHVRRIMEQWQESILGNSF